MQYVVGSAILMALILLILAATVGPRPDCQLRLRRMGDVLSLGIAGLVTAGDPRAFVLLLFPTLALYEATARFSR